MYEYNDYIATTRRWLKDYNRFLVCVDGMRDDMKLLQDKLASDPAMAAPIAKYEDMPGGGTPELQTVEKAAADRIKMEERLQQLRTDVAEIERKIKKLDDAMDTLETETRAIVEEHFIDGYNWFHVGCTHSISESWARKRGNRALADITFLIFGHRSCPPQRSFVFTE